MTVRSRMMHTFLVRLEILDGSFGNYDDLHKAMGNENFTKELPKSLSDGGAPALLQGEYLLKTEDEDPQHALDAACCACVKSGVRASILVVKASKITGMGRMIP